MKPVVTWIILANARSVKTVAHNGPSKGLVPVTKQNWSAPEKHHQRDKAGVGHSIGGPGVAAVEQTDTQEITDALFAKTVMDDLAKAYRERQFDRLILVAGPHMLGLLRANTSPALRAVLVGELSKDLGTQSLVSIERHLGKLIAV